MAEIPDQPSVKIGDEVYQEAAKAYLRAGGILDPTYPTKIIVSDLRIRAAVESAYRAGREDAARDIEAESERRGGKGHRHARLLWYAAKIARGEDQDTPEGRT